MYKLRSACEEARAGRHDVERTLLQARVGRRRGHCSRTHRLCPQDMTWLELTAIQEGSPSLQFKPTYAPGRPSGLQAVHDFILLIIAMVDACGLTGAGVGADPVGRKGCALLELGTVLVVGMEPGCLLSDCRL